MYEEILRHMLEVWSEKLPPADLIERSISIDITDLFTRPRKIVSIVGPRRAGKTFLFFNYTRN